MAQEVGVDEVDFEIIKDNWSRYQLRDGTLLRIRKPVIKILKTKIPDQFGRYNYLTPTMNIYDVIVPPNMKNIPSIPNQQVTAQDVLSEVDFDTINEDWSEYLLRNGTKIKVKPVVVKVTKTSKYNNFGDPIYLVDAQVIVRAEEPKIEK